MIKNLPLLTVLVVLPAAIALGQGNSAKEAAARKFCTANQATLHTIYEWIRAHRGDKPQLPTPPPTVPDCNECGVEQHRTPNQDKIDAYIKKLGEPEMGYVNQLLAIAHEMAMDFGSPPSAANIPTDMGYCAVYIDMDRLQSNVRFLMDRILLDKVIPSCEQYRGTKEYIPALEELIPWYCKAYAAIVGYTQGNAGGIDGYHSLDDQRYKNLQLAEQQFDGLMEAYYKYYLSQLFDHYQYNLYPGLMTIARTYELAGFHDDVMENDVYKYVNRGIAFMHFRLKMEFEESGPTYHYKLKGEAMVRCKNLNDTSGTCYSFASEDGKGIEMKMEDVGFTIPNVPAEYTGPKSTNDPFIVRINLCESSPVLHLIFTRWGLAGTMLLHTQAGNLTAPAPFHPEGYFAPNLAAAEDRKDKQEKLAADFKANMDKYKSAMMDWAAHRSDPAFASTPQGKKDMALIMEFQHQTGVQTPFLNAVQHDQAPAAALPTANNKLFTFDMPLQWSRQALDYEHSADIGGQVHYRIKITMEETPDNRDNTVPQKATN